MHALQTKLAFDSMSTAGTAVTDRRQVASSVGLGADVYNPQLSILLAQPFV